MGLTILLAKWVHTTDWQLILLFYLFRLFRLYTFQKLATNASVVWSAKSLSGKLKGTWTAIIYRWLLNNHWGLLWLQWLSQWMEKYTKPDIQFEQQQWQYEASGTALIFSVLYVFLFMIFTLWSGTLLNPPFRV